MHKVVIRGAMIMKKLTLILSAITPIKGLRRVGILRITSSIPAMKSVIPSCSMRIGRMGARKAE